MKAEEARRLKELEDENKRLKLIVAEQALDIRMLKSVAAGNWRALRGSTRRSRNSSGSSRSPSEGRVVPWGSRAVVNDKKRSLEMTNRHW
jgi:hypothetical protein